MLDFIIKYWIEFAFGIVIAVMNLIIKRLKKRLSEQERKNTAVEKGVQALLRNELIRRYREYEEKGEVSIIDMENIEHMYTEYRNLGGNGTVEKMYNDILKLETKIIKE